MTKSGNYVVRSRGIKRVSCDSTMLDNIGIMDVDSTRSVKVKVTKFNNLV